MSDALLIACAKEEGWQPDTACAAHDAANWLRRRGKTVILAQNDQAHTPPT